MRTHLPVILAVNFAAACQSQDASGPSLGANAAGVDSGNIEASSQEAEAGLRDAAPASEGGADRGPPHDAAGVGDGDAQDGGTSPDVDGCSTGTGQKMKTHEPEGMTVQLDTGPLTVTPAASGKWTNGNVTLSMYSPVKMNAEGESSANLVRVPCGSGLRILYQPSLEGGYSPVRFGTSIPSPGTTTYYQRWRVRTVPNWAGPRNGNGVKMCEPQALDHGPGASTGTNDILMMWPNGGQNDQMSAMEGLQGPNGHFANLGVNQGLVANLSDGQWHWDERIFIAESTAGAGDGQYYAYYDGVLVANYTDVLWVAPGGKWGINAWVVDPTFGGAPTTTHPLTGDYWDFDELYVSTK
jgi:hypothetical protein